MNFVLIDQSGGAKTGNGQSLTPPLLAQAAQVLTVYLNRYVGAYWGIPGGANVRAGSGPDDILVDELPDYTLPTLPDEPNDIAYHTVNGIGMPALYDGITLSDSLFGPGNGWLSAHAHEHVETVVNPAINRFAADGRGKLFAIEAADPVEIQTFPITIGTFVAYVSNFVLPSYFVPNHPGPYDYMTLAKLGGAEGPSAPFTVARGNGGNYQVVEDDPGHETQVMGKHGKRIQVVGSMEHRAAKKLFRASRTQRLLTRGA